MQKTAKILYLLVGCIMPIFIGSLHTFVHFKDLMSPEIEQFLQKQFVILGQEQSLWPSWGIVSFMMGASFIIICLLNLNIFRQIEKTAYPPVFALIAMIIYQICVTYVGFEFEQGFQLYGGIFGMLLLIISLVLTLRSDKG